MSEKERNEGKGGGDKRSEIDKEKGGVQQGPQDLREPTTKSRSGSPPPPIEGGPDPKTGKWYL
jgi:hypothetical protein